MTLNTQYDKDEVSKSVTDLLPLINTFWKLKQKIQKLNVGDKEMKPIETYLNSISDMFVGYGYEILDYTNKKYNFGDNIDILSVEGTEGEFYIRECLIPTVLFNNEIKQKASVIVERGNNEKY